MTNRSVVVKLRAEVDGFRRGMDDAAKSTDKAQKRFEATQRAGVGLAAVGAAMALGIGVAVKAYAEFDKQMSKVQAATRASAGEMQQLREAAINAGADTAFSAKEAGQAIEELSKAGVSTKDILGGGLDGALNLAAAGELEVGKASEIAASALTQFKLRGKDIPHVADLLAAGAGKAQGSVDDLGQALNQSGLVAAQYGLSIEDSVGGLAAFASAGLTGSDAGTSFKTMLQRLTPTSKEAADEMERIGFSAFDSSGNIKSLGDIAGNLQDSLKGMTEKQRNATLATLFGSDAVRAASVLYENGAKGVKEWTDKVNDAGYAAQTAAMNQNNLQGDLEKLSGSIDSVFLKSGSGMNDMLRGLAKNAEGLVDAIGGIPGPMLSAATGIGGTLAAVALLGGGLLVAIPKVAAAKATWDTFATSNEKLAGRMSKTAKAAGVLAAVFAGLQVVGAIEKSFGPAPKTMEDFAQATLRSKDRMQQLDAVFKDSSASGEIKGVGQALLRMNDNLILDNLDRFGADFANMNTLAGRLRDNVKGVDQQLQILSSGGAGDKAAALFRDLRDETDREAKAQNRASVSTENLLNLMPQYRDSLREQYRVLTGEAIPAQELQNLALGEIPPKMRAAMNTTEGKAKVDEIAAQANKELAERLADVGLKADGTIGSLSKVVDLMFKSGLVTLSARDAESAYQEALDGVKKATEEILAKQTAANQVMNQTKSTFDLTSDAGRKANGVFDDLATKAINSAQAMAENKGTQQQLTAKLKDSYKQLYDTARAFGASKDGADSLARSALNIPKGVKIDTAIANYAKSLAEMQGLKDEADKLNGKVVDVYFNKHHTDIFEPGRQLGKGAGPAITQEIGGVVPQYHAAGSIIGAVEWRRNGTDTTPVMATPGEFMIKRASARSIGYEDLTYMNNTGRLPSTQGPSKSIKNENHFHGAPAYTREQFEAFADQRLNQQLRRQ